MQAEFLFDDRAPAAGPVCCASVWALGYGVFHNVVVYSTLYGVLLIAVYLSWQMCNLLETHQSVSELTDIGDMYSRPAYVF